MNVQPNGPTHVTLFIQCIVDAMYPEVAEAMVHLFNKLGISVDYPNGQTCCGQPAFNSGYRSAARQAALHFMDVFEQASYIVSPSGSCVAMVRNHYPQLFSDDLLLARAKAVARKTFELTEFLVDVMKISEIGSSFRGRATYHDSCHLLRSLGVHSQPRTLLSNISGIELIEMEDADRCCGFGGAFAAKYPEISTALVADKVENILASGADTVVGCDMGCLMNIEGYLSRNNHHVKVKHIAQVLAG